MMLKGTALQLHYTENSKQIFLEMKLYGLVPNFYIHMCERFVYSHDRSANAIQQNRQTDRGNIHINCSQIHECRNWKRGRAVSFMGIFVSNFRYSARREILHGRLWTQIVLYGVVCILVVGRESKGTYT